MSHYKMDVTLSYRHSCPCV